MAISIFTALSIRDTSRFYVSSLCTGGRQRLELRAATRGLDTLGRTA